MDVASFPRKQPLSGGEAGGTPNGRVPDRVPARAGTVTFTPRKAGQVKLACGMDAVPGVVVFQ